MTPREAYEAVIAAPREAGTDGAARAVALLSAYLRERGWSIREQRFRFQPASLNALPLLGAGLGWLTLLELPLLLGRFPAPLAPLVWFGGATALGLLAWGIGTGVEVPGAERREDVNLIAIRGTEPVRRWLVAHVDTKAQGHSMAGRLVAVWVMLAAALVLSGLALWRPLQADPLPGWAVGVGAGLSLAGGALAARGRLQGATVGARDNGTGLLALLTAADAMAGPGTGLILTGAEEFGLVGARVLARTLDAEGVEVVNLDTLTDQGRLYVVAHDRRGAELARGLAPALHGIAPELRVRRLPAGILTDSVPFARAGFAAVTIGRLSWADLWRLHTPRDTPEELSLNTAEAVGKALGRLR